jgi:hypothetical protein
MNFTTFGKVFAQQRRLLWLLIGLLLPGFTGCGSGNTPQAALRDANRTNMQKLANLYSMYQVQHQFKGPPSEEVFREFIGQLDEGTQSKMGVDSRGLDKLFISERDREPFLIRYGVPSGPRGSKEPVVFELTGKRGQRMVGFLNMVQREVDPEEYQQLWRAEAKAPSSNDRDHRR